MKLWLAASLALLLAAGAGAQERPPQPAATPAVQEPAPQAPIPLPEVAERAEETSLRVREIESLVAASAEDERLSRRAAELDEGLRSRARETERLLAGAPRASRLDDEVLFWRAARTELSSLRDRITERAKRISDTLALLSAERDTWQRTREEALTQGAPAAVLERINATLDALARASDTEAGQLDEILQLQDRVARRIERSEELLRRSEAAQRELSGQLLDRNRPPIWQAAQIRPRSVAVELRDALWDEGRTLQEYFAPRLSRVGVQLALFAFLYAVLRWGRARREALGDDGELVGVIAILERPFAAALLLALLASFWLYPHAPSALTAATALLSAVPVLALLRGLVEPPVRLGVLALAGFFVVDRLRALLVPLALAEQLLFLLEMVAGAALAALALSSGWRRVALASGSTLAGVRLMAVGAPFFLAVCFFAALAEALGYTQFARLAGQSVLGFAYAALAIDIAVRVAESVVAIALRARPLRLLRMVRRHRVLIQRRAFRMVQLLGLLFLGYSLLDALGMTASALDALRRVLAAGLAFGSVRISVGGVLLFAVTVWATFLLSRFLRFVLEEDVYPRLPLARGVPYALSSLAHYGILLVGFFLAMSGLGVDLNRFTILAGALGVGVGFGLQNVVNNFVSGLILLGERPIQVGDTVQIADLVGEVRRIGMRSSTLRTWQGAEVIIPNANLISGVVTNWTLSDRSRRLDFPVGVAYGTDPARVLRILEAVGKAQGGVSQEPAPQALFVGFGESALLFELRVWTGGDADWLPLQTQVFLALDAALRAEGIEHRKGRPA